MSKTLITHINPHLDDICAIWLFKRFEPSFKGAEVDFISASNENKQDSEDLIYLGVGKGQFDEHKGDTKDCATSLVWKHFKSKNLVTDEITSKAVDRLVEWSKVIDLGRSPVYEYDSFTIPAFIRPLDGTKDASLKAIDLGSEILDRILEVLKKEANAEVDWATKTEFDSKYGKSFAVKSHFVNRPFCVKKGGQLFLMYDPKNGGVQYFTPSHEIDLEDIYKKVMELDPKASWFLHQSHHMVLCGANSAPDATPTNLTYEQLIDVAKKV